MRWGVGGRGSSPLARGLPAQLTGETAHDRIIPARAGFTPLLRRTPRRRADHPRSRGVYVTGQVLCRVVGGSSPLARGLLGGLEFRPDLRGIIPARAGFTAEADCGAGAPQDHPRSRGVYPPATTPDATLSWIIPARAGFTRRRRRRAGGARDHPRSRGVYSPTPFPARPGSGSSPLARGLRPGPATTSPLSGIIPARAGFTPLGQGRLPRRRDHPRSRGVYNWASWARNWAKGSSPLARGLLRPSWPPRPPSRIIPARAGFTHPSEDGHQQDRDHPRSRGVYSCLLHRASRLAGSSPLARGLLPLLVVEDLPLGIIPARAGFTAFRRVFRRRCRDHPRSRGVYRTSKGRSISMSGSSPLARGLPVQDQRRGGQWRIIPARAGFTRR